MEAVETGSASVGLEQGNPQQSVQPTSQPTPPVLDTGALASELAGLLNPKTEPTEPEVAKPTGLFNDSLPEGLQGNVALEGLFEVAKMVSPNLDLNRVMGRAWESGNPELLDVGYLREVMGDKAQYFETYFSGVVNEYQESQAQALDEWAKGVAEEFGGKEVLDRAIHAFNTNADPVVHQHVKALLDSRNPQERDAGVKLIQNFVQPMGIIPKTGRKVGGTAGAIPTSNQVGLGSKEFQEEVGKLTREGSLTPDAMNELVQRRAMGKSMGLN